MIRRRQASGWDLPAGPTRYVAVDNETKYRDPPRQTNGERENVTAREGAGSRLAYTHMGGTYRYALTFLEFKRRKEHAAVNRYAAWSKPPVVAGVVCSR